MPILLSVCNEMAPLGPVVSVGSEDSSELRKKKHLSRPNKKEDGSSKHTDLPERSVVDSIHRLRKSQPSELMHACLSVFDKAKKEVGA